MMTMTRTTDDAAYLPDDLEERYTALKAIIHDHDAHTLEERMEAMTTIQSWHRHWRELNEQRRLTGLQRRRIRRLAYDGEPITHSSGAESNLRTVEREQKERARHLRLKRTYGAKGEQAIAELVDKALYRHPKMPEDRAWEWAEKTFVNQSVYPV